METEPLKIVLGLLSRWGLLCMTAAAVAVAGVVAFASTARLTTAPAEQIVLPDHVFGLAEKGWYQVHAYRSPGATGNRGASMAVAIGTAPPRLMDDFKYVEYLEIQDIDPGIAPMTALGVPYGPLAFRTDAAVLQLIPPGPRVLLLDDAAAGVLLEQDARAFARFAAELAARDVHLVIVHPGPPEAYASFRTAIRSVPTRESPPFVPVMLEERQGKDDRMAAVRVAAWLLRATGRGEDAALLTTSAARAEDYARRARRPVYLLAPDAEAGAGVRVVRSLDEMRDLLVLPGAPR